MKMLISVILFVVLLMYFHFRGITYFDEGYILNAALRMYNGEIPYRDFDMVYTPVSYTITSLFFSFFGVSIFASRIAALVLSIASLYGLYLLLKYITPKKWVIFIALLFFLSWGPAHINFTWPTMFALCFFLYAIYFYLRGIYSNSGTFFFISGVLTVLTFLAKQNFGGGTLAVLVLFFLVIKLQDKWRMFFYYIGGVFALTAGYVLFLVSNNSLVPFIQNFYLYTLKRVFVDQSLQTAFLYEGPLYVRIAKFFLYTSPLVFSAIAIYFSRNSKKVLYLIPIMTAMFYLLGIRPTTDYVHLVSLLALGCLPLVMIFTHANSTLIKFSALIILIFMTGVGFYTACYKGYYQWEPPLKDANHLSTINRMQIFLTEAQVKDAEELNTYIRINTKPEEYIFVNYYAPLVYFISDRKNPTPYDLISVNQLPQSYQQQIINSLQEKKVTIVIMHYLNRDEKSIVTEFIKKHYKEDKYIGGFIIFKR